MSVPTSNFTTGPSTVPDIGTLSYNNCIFSPLFETTVSGAVVKDNAGRTTKYMEYTITADGYVTLPAGQASIAGTMGNLRALLTQQGGTLYYAGRGCDIIVNAGGASPVTGRADLVWGPVPELLEFQPLGGGLSAKVKWQCKTRIPEVPPKNVSIGTEGSIAGPLLQFNYETSVSYSEDGYSSLTVKGTLEIPLTRTPAQTSRVLMITVDNYRAFLNRRVFDHLDLSRFRITKRDFAVSRDKRTMEWNFAAEEKPYMDLPPDCTIARGNYSVRPAKSGMGLATWLCTLRATYTVRAGQPRRLAWLAFLALLRVRMLESRLVPNLAQQPAPPPPPTQAEHAATGVGVAADILGLKFFASLFAGQAKAVAKARTAFLMDLSFDEGLYLDSKTTSISATWRLNSQFDYIMLGSGLWAKLPEDTVGLSNVWATSVKDIMGSQSWLPNKLDPSLDIIVDFGGN